jgi:hypothetical protein
MALGSERPAIVLSITRGLEEALGLLRREVLMCLQWPLHRPTMTLANSLGIYIVCRLPLI